MYRRRFIQAITTAAAAAATGAGKSMTMFRPNGYTGKRPPVESRRFISDAVEGVIDNLKGSIADPGLRTIFENCFPNTLDTTVFYNNNSSAPDTFVITGDIDAMWLRDSSAQVYPYVAFARYDDKLRLLLQGVINRQAACILLDPYANAFLRQHQESDWKADHTDMKPGIHERKWEVDSLCYPVRLSYTYYHATGDTTPFNDTWKSAMKLVYDTFVTQQRKHGKGPYKFLRTTSWQTDTLPGGGYGNPAVPVGMIYSMFRPSDDATIFPFLIPSNLFAVVSLRQLSVLWKKLHAGGGFAEQCAMLADEVENAVMKYAVLNHAGSAMYAYEVDGFGNALYMDDANVPSLLSLPYLGVCKTDDEIYRSTRKYVLGSGNPYFFKGSAGEGIGGPHAGLDRIWHLAVIMRGLTSADGNEIAACLRLLKNTTAGTGFMHESFHKDDATQFSRHWFAWANTLFGEFIVTLSDKYPDLLKRMY